MYLWILSVALRMDRGLEVESHQHLRELRIDDTEEEQKCLRRAEQ